MNRVKGGFLFGMASALLVLGWLLYFLLLHDPVLEILVYAGWITLVVGLVLIVLPILALRGKGNPEQGEDFTRTTIIVDSGIYAVVRHPLYLGWSLMYVAVLLFGQHWLIVVIGAVGIVCMYLISKQEEQDLVEKFGDAYERYRESVPAMNLATGVVRLLRRRKEA
ncbi:MAG: isoprenylcysteine carboxylmethyltransferase family protein [Chloroflexi bacterium]|nr:isoprenylcysteine carboxylmethyltransferase family protein [Chloroflexota bacterium]